VKICSIVLAAGLGTRMKSSLPKVLHQILGKPIITLVLDAIPVRNMAEIIIVIAEHSEGIKGILNSKKISFAYQQRPLGTGDALKAGVKAIHFPVDHVLVLNGDTPLIKKETLNKLIKVHTKKSNDITLLSFVASDPTSYGRILRDEGGRVKGIVEEKDTTKEEKGIKEVNSGIYVFRYPSLEYLSQIQKNQNKGEYYLTDMISLCYGKGLSVDTLCMDDETEFIGINSRHELLMAQKNLQRRIARHWLERGVTLMDIDSIIISPDAHIGRDTTIYPNVILEGNTKVGTGCTIHSSSRIINSTIKDSVIIKNCTLIEDSTIHSSSSNGPFAYIRSNLRK